jgi:hypothetical protein
MTVLLDALLGLGLFNVSLLLIVVATCAFNKRRNRGRWREAMRRLSGRGVPAHRVPSWEPFVKALEQRPAVFSPRDIAPRD